MATVETDTVTLSINDREVTAPKGMSLVEAAAEAGIEVPVFCYEPRLGAAVGACRMCLVEIEGMPKLQTACTTPVTDGMVVHSHSDRAREGQDAVLEFLLINHPLDCPVCDKGGECPLQDLTFRYGPGSTRMTLPKRTHTKPVPISPLIKLDRERCILCYRCTRFSEDVSGDLQLVTEQRGANSIITTFEGRPYDGEFSGNVTELCPVGALTSTSYRFRGRPWEIQNIPTVCGECPIGCNTYATIREGQVARVLSRNNPAVDDGWLCDRGRYTFPSLESEQRITTPLIRGGRGLEPVDGSTALDHVADRLRAAVERFGPGSVAIIASGDQTSEEAHLWARIQEQALGGGPIVCGPEGGAGWGELAAHSATIADLDDADLIVVAGATDLVHRAPILELRIRRAVERGARVVTIGAGATRLDTLRAAEHVSAAPGTTHAALLAASQGVALKGLSDHSVILWNGRMSAPVATVLAHVAHTSGCRVLPTPLAANELGCQAAGLGTHTPAEALEAVEQGRVKAVVLLGADPVGGWPDGERWRGLMERAFFALQVSPFQTGSSGWATTIVPSPMPLEKEGTFTNIEGRVQRLRAAVPPPPGVLRRDRAGGRAGPAAGPRPARPAARRVRRHGRLARVVRRPHLGRDRRKRRAPRAGPRHRRGAARAARSRGRAGGDDRGRLPPADERADRGGRPGAAFPAPQRHRDLTRRRPADRRRHRRPGRGQLRRRLPDRCRAGAAAAATGRRAAGDSGAVRRAGRAAGCARGGGRCLTGSSSPPSSRSCWSTW